MILIKFIFFIFLFLNIKCTDDPIKEGRYCVFDEGNFNVGFLEEVKNYLKENKEEIFYLFPVEEVHLIDFNKNIKEQHNKENIIYYSKDNFGSELFNLYVNPKNFVENNENCGYINFTKGKLESKKYVTWYTIEFKCLNISDNVSIAKNSKNDQPVIFKLLFHKGDEKFYFCSNIGIISEYLSRKSKKLSLFKNNNIKGFEAVLFLKVKNYFDNMFYDCNNLKTIFFKNNKQIYIDGDSLFEGCINLEDISNFYNFLNTKKSNFVFKNCKNLTNACVHENFILGDYCFEGCEKLKMVSPIDKRGRMNNKKNCSIASTGCFKNCFSLRSVNYNLNSTGDPKELFYGCKNLEIPKTIITLNNKDEDFSFTNMFYGINKENNDKITIQFNRNNEDDRIPDFNYDNAFNGCDVEKKDIIVKELDGQEKILENITKDDKIKWFIYFPDNYKKLRDLYQDAYDSTLLSYLNGFYKDKRDKEEIEKEYNELKKQHEENYKITNQKTEEVNVDKNLDKLGPYGKCGLCFTKCCCCCCNR